MYVPRVRPRLLDLFCGAGGAAMGYHRAGFDVLGVDWKPQPSYPFPFVQADALEFLRSWESEAFDAIHASPPCQAYSSLRHLSGKEYPELISPVRELLLERGVPYVIENVAGALHAMRSPVMLCGSAMGLPLLRRHRFFECSFAVLVPECRHWIAPKIFPALSAAGRREGGKSGVVGVYGNGGDKRSNRWAEAMGIDWMTRRELTQAIPPAYTEHLGAFLLAALPREEPRLLGSEGRSGGTGGAGGAG